MREVACQLRILVKDMTKKLLITIANYYAEWAGDKVARSQSK